MADTPDRTIGKQSPPLDESLPLSSPGTAPRDPILALTPGTLRAAEALVNADTPIHLQPRDPTETPMLGPSDHIVSPSAQPGNQTSPQRAGPRANDPVDTDRQQDPNTATRSFGNLPARTGPAQGENAPTPIRDCGPPVNASLIPHRRVPPASRDRLVSSPGMMIIARGSIGGHRNLDQPSHGAGSPTNPFGSATTGAVPGGPFASSSWRPSSQSTSTSTRSSPLPPLPSPTHATSERPSRVPRLPSSTVQSEAAPGASPSAHLQLRSAAVASLNTLFETSSLGPASPTTPSLLQALPAPPSSTSPMIVTPLRIPLPASSPALPPPDSSRLRSDEIRPATSAGRQQSSTTGASPVLIHRHVMQSQDGRWTATASPNSPTEIADLPSTIIRGARTQLAVDLLASTDPARDSPATGGVTGGARMEDEVEAEVEEDAATGQHEAADENHTKEYSLDFLIAQRKVRGNAEPRSTRPTWTEQRKQQVIEELNASQATRTDDHVRVSITDAAKDESERGAKASAGASAGVEGADEVKRGIFEFSDNDSYRVVSSTNGNASRESANFNNQHMTIKSESESGSGSGSRRGEGLGEHASSNSNESETGKGNEKKG